jgi:hypothetical protein
LLNSPRRQRAHDRETDKATRGAFYFSGSSEKIVRSYCAYQIASTPYGNPKSIDSNSTGQKQSGSGGCAAAGVDLSQFDADLTQPAYFSIGSLLLQSSGFPSTLVVHFGFNSLTGSEAVDSPAALRLCRCGGNNFLLACQFLCST